MNFTWVIMSARTFVNECLQRPRRQNNHAVSFKLQPFAALPIAQLLVCAFAGRPYHLADFMLGDAYLIWHFVGRWAPIEMQKHFCKTIGQTQKYDIFNLFARPPQARTQYFNQPHGNVRVLAQQSNEIATFDDHKLAAFDDDSIGGARSLIKKSNLTKDIARNHQIKYSIASLFGR